jgi:hypothetical protein
MDLGISVRTECVLLYLVLAKVIDNRSGSSYDVGEHSPLHCTIHDAVIACVKYPTLT